MVVGLNLVESHCVCPSHSGLSKEMEVPSRMNSTCVWCCSSLWFLHFRMALLFHFHQGPSCCKEGESCVGIRYLCLSISQRLIKGDRSSKSKEEDWSAINSFRFRYLILLSPTLISISCSWLEYQMQSFSETLCLSISQRLIKRDRSSHPVEGRSAKNSFRSETSYRSISCSGCLFFSFSLNDLSTLKN